MKVVVGSVVYLERGSFESSETKKYSIYGSMVSSGADLFKRGSLDGVYDWEESCPAAANCLYLRYVFLL